MYNKYGIGKRSGIGNFDLDNVYFFLNLCVEKIGKLLLAACIHFSSEKIGTTIFFFSKKFFSRVILVKFCH